MNVLRHHNISVNAQLEATAHVLQAVNKEVEHVGRLEIRLTPIATESYEVGLSRFLKSPETTGHEINLHGVEGEVKCRPG
jgi:hypothetical protein